jgi:hypothetical protein
MAWGLGFSRLLNITVQGTSFDEPSCKGVKVTFLRYLEAFTPPGEHYTNPVMITVPRYYPRPRKDRLAALRSWAVSMSNDADGKSTSTRLSAGSCAINSRSPTSPTTPSARG